MADTKEAVKDKQGKAEAAQSQPVEKSAKKSNPVSDILQKFPWLVFVVAGLIVAAVVYAGVVKPVQSRLAASQSRVKAAQAAVPTKLEILSRKDFILKRSAALEPFFAPADFSQEKIIAQFLQEIEKISQAEGLFISNINPVKVDEAGSGSHLLSVDLEGAADVVHIKKFIKSVEESIPSARVDAYNIRTQGQDSPELRYRFTVQKLVMVHRDKTSV